MLQPNFSENSIFKRVHRSRASLVLPFYFLAVIIDLQLTGNWNIGFKIVFNQVNFKCWTFLKGFANCMSSQEVEQHLEMGKKLLAVGQLADALTQFHSAIGN